MRVSIISVLVLSFMGLALLGPMAGAADLDGAIMSKVERDHGAEVRSGAFAANKARVKGQAGRAIASEAPAERGADRGPQAGVSNRAFNSPYVKTVAKQPVKVQQEAVSHVVAARKGKSGNSDRH